MFHNAKKQSKKISDSDTNQTAQHPSQMDDVLEIFPSEIFLEILSKKNIFKSELRGMRLVSKTFNDIIIKHNLITTKIKKLALTLSKELDQIASDFDFLKRAQLEFQKEINRFSTDRSLIYTAKKIIEYVNASAKHGFVRRVGTPLIAMMHKNNFILKLTEFINTSEKMLSQKANFYNKNKSSVANLPKELLLHVFNFLTDKQSVKTIPTVCKDFYTISQMTKKI